MPDLIRSSRLSFHAPSMDDLNTLAAMWADPVTMRFVGAGKPWTETEVRERLERAISTQERTGMAFWVVRLIESGQIIGQAGVVPIEGKGPEIELGYRLGRAHWGHGYATEAAIACANYATDPDGPLAIERLIAVAYPENAASRRVLAKVGFTELGETDLYYGVTCSLYEFDASAFAERWRIATYPCPCCGCLTIDEPNTFEICSVCYWEDDGQNDEDASVVRGGPNGALSLTAARENFVRLGASESEWRVRCRMPHHWERPEE